MFRTQIGRWSVALLLGVAVNCARSAKGADQSSATHLASAAGDTRAPSVGESSPVDSDVIRADQRRVQGSDKATVWFIMASDFQCPYCKEWHDANYATLVKDYVKTGKIRMAYVNFPVAGSHPHAIEAAEAAMCASAQGHFWEMHDALFATQTIWAPRASVTGFLDSLAIRVGVDATRWRACVKAHTMRALIDADQARSSKGGVKGTPSFFIGSDTLITGAQPYAVFQTAISAELAKAAAGKKSPVP